MSLSQSDIDSFHLFASQELTLLGPDQDLEEIVRRWQAQLKQAETLASIRRGVKDAEAGRFQDIGTVDRSIREKLGFPARR